MPMWIFENFDSENIPVYGIIYTLYPVSNLVCTRDYERSRIPVRERDGERKRERQIEEKRQLDVAPIRKYSYYAQLHGLLVRQYLFYRPDAVPLPC